MLNQDSLDKIRRLGGEELLRKTFDIFKRDSQQELARAKEALVTGDLQVVRKAAHRIKPSAGMIGAVELQQFCQLVEKTADEGDGQSLAALLEELEFEFRRVCSAIEKL